VALAARRMVLGEATERHAVVDQHVVADLGRLADHHAHAVVDEEPPPILAPGWISMPVMKRVVCEIGARERA
jgi:hypothetical protein